MSYHCDIEILVDAFIGIISDNAPFIFTVCWWFFGKECTFSESFMKIMTKPYSHIHCNYTFRILIVTNLKRILVCPQRIGFPQRSGKQKLPTFLTLISK